MKIKNLKIENILSIEKAEINFGDNGLILVEGFDYDTQRANGAGKSSIFNALSFALFDKTPRGITKSEIIRKGQNRGSSWVTVSTTSGDVGVKRERPNNTIYYINGSVVDITQEEFEDKIGMNYDQFLITMYTAQDTNNKFIYLNDSGKKNFILKIMNLSYFSKYRIEVAEQIKKLQLEESMINGRMEGHKTSIEIYKNSITDDTHLQSLIDQCNKDIIAYTKEIKKLEQVQKPDLSKYEEAENKIAVVISDINATKTLRRNAVDMFQSYNTMIKPFNPKNPDTSCPVCSTDLNIQGKTLAKADDIDALKKQHEAHNRELEDKKKEYKIQIDKYDVKLAKENDLTEAYNKLKAKKIEESKDYANAQENIHEYKNSIKLKNSENLNYQNQIEKNKSIREQVASIIVSAQKDKERLTAIKTEEVLLGAVESVFDTTGAPAYIMDSIVDSFNEAVADYITEIWPTASYSLQTYKENKDKSIKAKFSESLIINGKQRSIGSLSGGEIRALSLVLDFAIIDVLSSKYALSINPVILDEPFNGLDAMGRELVVDILKKLSENRQIWVVDHASEAKALFDDVIRVEKRNGISKIV